MESFRPVTHSDGEASNPPAVAQERPTPRVDEMLREFATPDDALVKATFARQLERELAEANEKLARLPADWSKDSSLETWFPYTAEELKGWRAIKKSQAEEIERLRGALEKIRNPFNCMTRGETCELINAALAATSGHLVSQIPQNMNDNPGCALDLSDNSSGPRMVRREVLDQCVKALDSCSGFYNSDEKWEECYDMDLVNDATRAGTEELARTAPDKTEGGAE